MNINNLLNAINEIKDKAEEQGIEVYNYEASFGEITFLEKFDTVGYPIFATYNCESDEIIYE